MGCEVKLDVFTLLPFSHNLLVTSLPFPHLFRLSLVCWHQLYIVSTLTNAICEVINTSLLSASILVYVDRPRL